MKPRIMWADFDPTDKFTPVSVYTTKTDQRMNRPDLVPIRVLVRQVSAGYKIPTVRRARKISRVSKQAPRG